MRGKRNGKRNRTTKSICFLSPPKRNSFHIYRNSEAGLVPFFCLIFGRFISVSLSLCLSRYNASIDDICPITDIAIPLIFDIHARHSFRLHRSLFWQFFFGRFLFIFPELFLYFSVSFLLWCSSFSLYVCVIHYLYVCVSSRLVHIDVTYFIS